jgi:hypothetical protein
MFVMNKDKNGLKNIDGNNFSSSRYNYVDDEEEIMPFYEEQARSYAVPESKIDIDHYNSSEGVTYDMNDPMYNMQKEKLNRTKILLMSTNNYFDDSKEGNCAYRINDFYRY